MRVIGFYVVLVRGGKVGCAKNDCVENFLQFYVDLIIYKSRWVFKRR